MQHHHDAPDQTVQSVPAADEHPSGNRSLEEASRAPHLLALEHLAADLRTACPEGTALTWAEVAHYTLTAAQHASTASPTARGGLKRRELINDGLYRAFMTRKHGQPWTKFDSTTLLLAVGDLVEAEHARPMPEQAL